MSIPIWYIDMSGEQVFIYMLFQQTMVWKKNRFGINNVIELHQINRSANDMKMSLTLKDPN